MISFIVLHYNRPYFLDLHVRLLRTYCKQPMEVIVADNGTKVDLKSIPYDKMIQETCSVSELLRKAVKLVSGDVIVYSEDDFLMTPIGCHHDIGFVTGTRASVDMFFPMKGDCMFTEALQVLEQFREVQLVKNWDHHVKGHRYNNRYVMPEPCKVYYHSNWPHMIRSEDQLFKDLPDGLCVNQIEHVMCSMYQKVFGPYGWVAVADPGYYRHVGLGYSCCNMSKDRKEAADAIKSLLCRPNFTQQQLLDYLASKKLGNFDELFKYGLNKYLERCFCEV